VCFTNHTFLFAIEIFHLILLYFFCAVVVFWAETDVSTSNINFVSVAIAVHFFLFINLILFLSTFIYCSTSAIDAHKGASEVITYKVDTPSTILGLDKEIFRRKN
jgi:hypothetical protein